MSFIKWTDIENFHNVRKAAVKYYSISEPITYRGKIKLHGTNAGIIIKPNGDIFAQSRSGIIGTGNDNAGFAQYIENTKDYWSTLATTEQITIFCEWFGKGIQKGVAASQIVSKHVAIFSIQIGEYDEDGNADMIIEPSEIEKYIAVDSKPDNVHILPWYGEKIIIDYTDTTSLEVIVEKLNKEVETVEACDPWIKDVFGISGTGEGLVYYPISFSKNGVINRWHLSRYLMKCKGEKHKVQKDRKAVILDPEIVASSNAFVEKFVTESRLEQGATEVNRGVLDFDTKLIGPFLKWFNGDVNKECTDELEASGLEWKQVAKGVSTAARNWYIEKSKEL